LLRCNTGRGAIPRCGREKSAALQKRLARCSRPASNLCKHVIFGLCASGGARPQKCRIRSRATVIENDHGEAKRHTA
jgi:hypothetical protein